MQARSSKTSNRYSSNSMTTKWHPFNSKWPTTSSTSPSPTTSKSLPWTLSPQTSRNSALTLSSRDPQPNSFLSNKNKSISQWSCQVRWVRCKISILSNSSWLPLRSHIRELALMAGSKPLISGFSNSSSSSNRWLLIMRATLAIFLSHSNSRLKWSGRLRSSNLQSWKKRSSSSNSSSRNSNSSWCSRQITVRPGSSRWTTTLSLWMTVMQMSNNIRVWKRASKALTTNREVSNYSQWIHKRVHLRLLKTTRMRRRPMKMTLLKKISCKSRKRRKLMITKSLFVSYKLSSRNSKQTLILIQMRTTLSSWYPI